jgi:S-DNA-T family DNA segregation ATPase FtsK/SpoIIIE
MASYQARYQNGGRDPLLDQGTAMVLEKRGRELIGLALVVLGLICAAMIVSYSPDDPSWLSATDAPVQNWMGRFGAYVAAPLFMIVGVGTWALAITLLAWGARFALHRTEGRAFARMIFLPIWVALCAIYASGLPQSGAWSHHFGLGGLFGDMVMGSFLTALPMSPAAGLKVMMLLLGLGILAMGAFVLGFDRAELKSAGRFLMVGVVMSYALVMRMLGKGASEAFVAARNLKAVQAERMAERRATRQAAAEVGDYAEDYAMPAAPAPVPAAPLVRRNVPPMSAPQQEMFDEYHDDVVEPEMDYAPEPRGEKQGFLSRMPSLIRRPRSDAHAGERIGRASDGP